MEMNRREFLGLMGRGATMLAIGGLEGVLSGCATKLPRVNEIELASYYNSITSLIDDPNNYLRFLREREYIVPDDIFESYARTVDKRPEWLSDPMGGYLSRNYLDTNEERKEFIDRLNKLGLSEEEISFYSTLFTSSDIIIFKESVLKDKNFEKIVPHERFHMAMKRLNKEDYDYMMDVANELLDRRDDGARFVRERDDSEYVGGFAVVQAQMNPEEFYTYLAQGEFMPRVEEVLNKDYPRTYEIFNRIRDECRLR